MQALREAYRVQGLETELTKRWDELLENFTKGSLTEIDTFDTLNARFWNAFSFPPALNRNYAAILNKTETPRLHIPNRLANYLVDDCRKNCGLSDDSGCSDALECSLTLRA